MLFKFLTFTLILGFTVETHAGTDEPSQGAPMVIHYKGTQYHHAPSSGSGRSKRDTSTQENAIVSNQTLVPDACWLFTWVNSRVNNTPPNCFDINKQGNPCFEPLVITEDGTEPDLSLIQEAFLLAGVETFTCNRGRSNLCMRYTHYKSGNEMHNISWFCGSVTDTTLTTQLTYGDRSQTFNGGKKRVKFCKGRLCNAATIADQPGRVFLFLVAILTLVLNA